MPKKEKKKTPVKQPFFQPQYKKWYVFCIVSVVIFGAFDLWARYLFTPRIDETKMVTVLPHSFKEIDKKRQEKLNAITFRLPILMYHYVEYVQDPKDTIRASLNIQPHIFEAQIKTLKDAGYQFLTMTDVADAFTDKTTIASRSVIITFDDGYRDFYTDVFPIVKKYNAKVTAYIVPGFLDHPNFMLSEQLDEINKSDLVELGAHTMHHAWLRGIAKEAAQYEIEESKKALEAILKKKVEAFAYPYGAFDDQAVTLVKNAGFTTAVSTVPGIQMTQANRYYMYRVRPGQRTGQTLLTWLQQSSYVAW